MTFEEFWKEHEKELAAQFYGPSGWSNIYNLAFLVWEKAQQEKKA